MKDLWDNTIANELYALPTEFKFSNYNELTASPSLTNTKSLEYNYNILSPAIKKVKEIKFSKKPPAIKETISKLETILLADHKTCAAISPVSKTVISNKEGHKRSVNDYTEYILKKRSNPSVQDGTSGSEPIQNAKTNFKKQIGRVKYYWRGTNFNYPFTFMRMYDQKSYEDCKSSVFSEGQDEFIYCVEDLSKKKINPTEFLYR